MAVGVAFYHFSSARDTINTVVKEVKESVGVVEGLNECEGVITGQYVDDIAGRGGSVSYTHLTLPTN